MYLEKNIEWGKYIFREKYFLDSILFCFHNSVSFSIRIQYREYQWRYKEKQRKNNNLMINLA